MFADVIVDISHEAVNRCFEYIIPKHLEDCIKRGSQVNIPFGKSNKLRKGFVINVKNRAAWDSARLKNIDSVIDKSITMESSMVELADFIATNYGGTMIQALKTVLPVKQKSQPVIEKYITLCADDDVVKAAIDRLSENKRSVAKLRLLKALDKEKILPKSIVKDRLNISDSTIRSLEKDALVIEDIKANLRDAINIKTEQNYDIILNPEQQKVSEGIWNRYLKGDLKPSLLRGVTGSGKTEIYIDLVDKVIKQGKQAIVLIPEIALTYQTVIRFYRKFGDRISVINSKLTPAQKHDQLEKAKRGDVDVIIGPRSALFTPFERLGIIIIDEEHEETYRNENVPRYHAREVAIKRASLCGAFVLLGSATPSVESYFKAQKGEYQLYEIDNRAGGASFAEVEVVDLRDELGSGNRSMVSRLLYEKIADRLEKKEQIMLFINRRGHSSFVSCRECGKAIMCPHCDISLKYHNNGKLICHYCGYEQPMVKLCPSCGSKYIGTFGSGTQKVEEEINRLFPGARTLRMDFDTTRAKEGHEKILSAFKNKEADILIGTQMIVKGHDFANVTLVGIMAADLSLYSNDYQAPERTFQLITQAAGRAGRGEKKGKVIIQTYSPDNYAIIAGANQDYKGFYEYEMNYRSILGYPPVMNMLGIMISGSSKEQLDNISKAVGCMIDEKTDRKKLMKIGPVEASIARINDRFRNIIYLKAKDYNELIGAKDIVEAYFEAFPNKDILVTFDFSTIGGQ